MNRSHTHTTHIYTIYIHRSNKQMSFYLYCRNSRTKNQHSYDENVTIFRTHFFRENRSPSPTQRWPDQYTYFFFIWTPAYEVVRIPSNYSFTSEMFGEHWMSWYDGICALHYVPEVEISASGCVHSNFQTYELHNICHEFGWPLFIIITG